MCGVVCCVIADSDQSEQRRVSCAYLNNWLVNLTGKLNAFKEIDLLQEHQNFWANGPENHRIQVSAY
jgi:hypothetical protein